MGEENPLLPSAEEHTRGTRGAPPKAQECKTVFWYAAGRSGTGGIFATRPPVPSRHQILTCLEAWEARAENFPFTR